MTGKKEAFSRRQCHAARVVPPTPLQLQPVAIARRMPPAIAPHCAKRLRDHLINIFFFRFRLQKETYKKKMQNITKRYAITMTILPSVTEKERRNSIGNSNAVVAATDPPIAANRRHRRHRRRIGSS